MQVTINGAFSSLITSQEEKHGLNYYRCSCIDLIYYHFSKLDHRFAWVLFIRTIRNQYMPDCE